MRADHLPPSAAEFLAEIGAPDAPIGDVPGLTLRPAGIEEVLEDVITVADAIGRPEAGEAAVVRLRGRYWTAVDFVNPYIEGPEVAFLQGMDPLVVGGRWIPGLIEAAGGRHSVNPPGAEPRQVTGEQLVAAAPRRLIVCPCGDDLDAIAGGLDVLTGAAWWNDLPAVREKNVVMVNGETMFNRPGPRLVDAFRWLVGWINERPEVVPEGFPVRGVER